MNLRHKQVQSLVQVVQGKSSCHKKNSLGFSPHLTVQFSVNLTFYFADTHLQNPPFYHLRLNLFLIHPCVFLRNLNGYTTYNMGGHVSIYRGKICGIAETADCCHQRRSERQENTPTLSCHITVNFAFSRSTRCFPTKKPANFWVSEFPVRRPCKK